MKIFFSVFICFSFVFQTFSQSTFEILFENPLTQSCWDICEDNNNNYYGVGFIGEQNQPSSYKGIMYKISEFDAIQFQNIFSTLVGFFDRQFVEIINPIYGICNIL